MGIIEKSNIKLYYLFGSSIMGIIDEEQFGYAF